MSEAITHHRLEGLEPDNLLAFLALLGLLRSLEAIDRELPENERLYPRACWELYTPPLRPMLSVWHPIPREKVAEIAARGLAALAANHDFGEWNRSDLNYTRSEARTILDEMARAATVSARGRADLLASLMSDAATKEDKNLNADPIAPTPLCLLFGQGHQHFLERLRKVPSEAAPPQRGKGKAAVQLSAEECLSEALFAPWHRSDSTFSFRWDPEEDVRYALMAGDPADQTYKYGTQHGANRLAAVGLAVLTIVPETRAGRIRSSVLGGSSGRDGFSFTWPIWKEPATLSAIRSMLGHPDLLKVNGLSHLGVDHALTAKRISVGKFMNFTRAGIKNET
jgi:hypothetical protein